MDQLAAWLLGTLILSLRIAPVFAFAPPFTLVRVPLRLRLMLGLALAGCLTTYHPNAQLAADATSGVLAVAAARELLLGAITAAVFQIAFSALYIAGRTVDIQAGFGLSLLIDPTSNAQTPLAGTLLAYAAGSVFFAMDGHAELLRIFAASLDAIPLGGLVEPPSPGRIAGLMTASCLVAFGVVGGAVLCLFIADLAIALLSRTTPQMNVLVLGFQLKTVLFFVALPTSFGMGGALLARLVRIALEGVVVML